MQIDLSIRAMRHATVPAARTDSRAIPVHLPVMADVNLPPLSKLAYAVIDALDAPTQIEIAAITGSTPNGIQKALRALCKAGWLLAFREGTQNRYICMKRSPAHSRASSGVAAYTRAALKPSERQVAAENAEFFRSRKYREYLSTFCRRQR